MHSPVVWFRWIWWNHDQNGVNHDLSHTAHSTHTHCTRWRPTSFLLSRCGSNEHEHRKKSHQKQWTQRTQIMAGINRLVFGYGFLLGANEYESLEYQVNREWRRASTIRRGGKCQRLNRMQFITFCSTFSAVLLLFRLACGVLHSHLFMVCCVSGEMCLKYIYDINANGNNTYTSTLREFPIPRTKKQAKRDNNKKTTETIPRRLFRKHCLSKLPSVCLRLDVYEHTQKDKRCRRKKAG